MCWSIKASNESRWFTLEFIKQVSLNFVLNENHERSPLQTYLQLCHKYQDAVVPELQKGQGFFGCFPSSCLQNCAWSVCTGVKQFCHSLSSKLIAVQRFFLLPLYCQLHLRLSLHLILIQFQFFTKLEELKNLEWLLKVQIYSLST